MTLARSLILTVALLTACSADKPRAVSNQPADGSGLPRDSGSPADPGPYPAGPYGNTVGAVLTNLQLQGYVNESGTGVASDQPWTDAYSLDDLRATGAKYALVHVSEFF